MIRRLIEKDIDDIIKLENDVLNITLGIDMLKSSINSNMAYYYVYIDDNKILGYISSSFDGDTIEILNFCVSRSYQNKKIGTKLLSYLIKELYILGANNSILEVREGNKGAIKFYKKFGYEIINIRKNYYNNNENALLMQKKLTSFSIILSNYYNHFCNIIDHNDYIEYRCDNFKIKYDFNKYVILNSNNLINTINEIKNNNDKNYLEINIKSKSDILNNMPKIYCGIMYNNTANINIDIKYNNVVEFDNKYINDYIDYCYNVDITYDIEYAKLNGKFKINNMLNNKSFKAYLIYKNNILIGKLDVYIYKDNAYIEDFNILDKYRLEGYGSSLFMSAINKLKDLGVFNIYLEVDNNDTPINMYKKWGFSVIDNYYVYHEE